MDLLKEIEKDSLVTIEKVEAFNPFYPTLDENWLEKLDQMDEVASENIWYLINSFTGKEDESPLTLKELIAFTMNIYDMGYSEGVKANKKKTHNRLCTDEELEWLDKELNS